MTVLLWYGHVYDASFVIMSVGTVARKYKVEIAVVVDLVVIVLHTTLQRNLKLP